MISSLPETSCLSSGLDYYKPTMSQLAFEQEPDAVVTFSLHNRGNERLMGYLQPEDLQRRFVKLQTKGWSQHELDYLASLHDSKGKPIFESQYLEYIQVHKLPDVVVQHDKSSNDLAVTTTGNWALSTFWETIVMSELSEAYFESYLQAQNIDPYTVYDKGNKHLDEKIAILQANPGIKIADFGTRRHFSLRWQRHVLERLISECPDNIVGTSNVALVDSLHLRPVGTFAHEMPMVYAALANARGEDIRASHSHFLKDWFVRYGEDYAIALTDTFTTNFFLADFSPTQAKEWRGVRQDSGDPVACGERLIAFYESQNIDPKTKTIVFSDALDITMITSLFKHFEGRINLVFGWGTNLTNDLDMQPLNIVMKATHVRSANHAADTVKLSDDLAKCMGPPKLIEEYKNQFLI